MTVITKYFALSDQGLASKTWRRMVRIDTVGADTSVVIKTMNQLALDCLVYAEGDSWFDKFTPIPREGTNLLEEIRTPYVAGVVDVAHIGDEARDMVRGWQASRTREMFRLFSFKAILLSAGGNDLKNLFSDLFENKGLLRAGQSSRLSESDLAGLATPASYTAFFQDVITNIQRFVDMRDDAKDPITRKAPIFLHGYDYLQPRPAGATIFAGSRIGRGPWLYPSLLAAGLSDVEMRSVADAIVDELNRQLQLAFAAAPNVHVIDQRGLLTPADPQSEEASNDWLDEIHPNEDGFAKLARNRWEVELAKALGWSPNAGDLQDPLPANNSSTALGGGSSGTG
ncbi:SGNH/GDSL hydrolase family protein [Variovorax sp. J22R24]|uniref:SGNH/GDSL hydrolase family protein n=1 Tax=Variovorax gracilis TaxID=3053502 RepID=UPI0025749009|nr:SGNH/GDSL hydrolase family protein [Variovorax sp. J22R24]MDM0104960.1 SGNH/GDSL hydrolase family protein [Variovorax sp. J22R24]